MRWFVREWCFLDQLEVAAVLKWFARLHIQCMGVCNLQCRHTWARDVKNAKHLQLKTFFSRSDTTDPFKRLRIWQNIQLHTVILHSKVTKITPKRPQITPDQTRSFLYWASPNNFYALPHSPPPKPKENPYTSNGPTVAVFQFKSENITRIANAVQITI